ncbi:MAG: hypothetical protein IIZ54_06425 [Selenomonadaceae bacterium]|nr:hypothetical protein [Selenomonadaceae bacterium]
MKNEVVKKLPINIQPPSNCACIDCPHAHWHASEYGNPECKCRLMSVIVWKLSRDENCVTACTGLETLEMRPNPHIPCVSCQYAVWYKDSGELHGYCRDIYRKIYGKDFSGRAILSISDCNAYKKMEVL